MPMLTEVESFWFSITRSMQRIIDCMHGLSMQELTWAPLDNANSLCVLATHVMGNIAENLVEVLGGQPVNRQREAEFNQADCSPEDIIEQWQALQARALTVLEQMPASELERIHPHPRRSEMSGREVLILAAVHTAEHAGQAELTRDLLKGQRGDHLKE